MTDLEKGYIAGLIDGEGSISLYKDHADQKFRYPAIEITSTTLPMLEMVKNIAGGAISKQKVYKSTYALSS